MLDFSISLSATGRKKFWGMYSSKFIFLRNICSRLFFLFWPFRCRQGKIVFLLFYAIFCVAVSRKIFWIVIWWVNIFFKKSDLFISSSVYFSLKRKGRKKEANWYDCAWWQAMEMIWNQKCYLQTSRLKQCRWPFPSC